MLTSSSIKDRTELFLRFSRLSFVALLVLVVVLGATGLMLALSPVANWEAKLQWWLLPLIAGFSFLFTNYARRHHLSADAPEVKVAMEDEWRRSNMLRAARIALVVALVGQWPLGLAIGFLTRPDLTPPRVAGAMAVSTIMLGMVTTIVVFLFLDRE
jgi:hypothetical protein